MAANGAGIVVRREITGKLNRNTLTKKDFKTKDSKHFLKKNRYLKN